MRSAPLIALCVGLLAGPLAGSGCVSSPQRLDAPRAGRGGRSVGWVRTQRVDLLALRVQLDLAWACRRTPRPAAQSVVLRRAQVIAAECRTRAYEGPLAVYGVDAAGTRHGPLWTEQVEAGALRIDFAAAESISKIVEPDAPELVALELGEGAWAGVVQLDRLREFRRRWHATWVEQGRGSAALFWAAHPEQLEAGAARALAIEAQLARQERDYLEVAAGRASARRFLERHLWSPYRASVLRMEDRANSAESPPSP